MSPDQRSPEAMETERRELEKALISRPVIQAKPKHRNAAKSERFGTIGEALAALKAKMGRNPAPEQLYRCRHCQDSGWQELDTVGRGTVRRCPKGCELPRKREARTSSGSKSARQIS